MTPARVAVAATLVLRVVLLAYPRTFRHAFGREILDHVTREVSSARGGAAAVRRALREIATAAGDAPAEHLAAWRGRPDGQPSSGRARDGLMADFRLARRQVTGSPLASGIVIVTFALAIGAATAIFSVADAVLFRPLPFPSSDRLVRLDEETREASRAGVSVPAFEIWTRELRSLDGLAFFEPRTTLVLVNDEPDRLSGAAVSPTFFDVLGVRPALGAGFTQAPVFAGPREVVVSHALWQRLGGTESVLGASIAIDPGRFTIVGVMPRDFSYPEEAQYWTTVGDMGILGTERTLRFLLSIGRLTPEADIEALRAELDVLTERHPVTDPSAGSVRMTATGLRESIVGRVRTGVLSAGAAVALLLMVACCNITALLLAQASARHRERAVQMALGASGARIARQQLIHVACLAVPGGALGVLAALFCRDAIVALSLDEVPRIAGAAIDQRVWLFAFAVTAGAALAATLMPSWLAARTRATAALQAGSRSGGHARPVLRALRGLVVAQVALTFVLAVAAGLLARTFDRLSRVDLGFEPAGVLSLRINLPLRALTPAAQRLFYEDVLRRVRALPGVQSASYASRLPLSAVFGNIEVTRAATDGPAVRAVIQSASGGYLSTIGARLVAGRDFASADAAAPAVIINDVMARQLFPVGEASGQRVRFSFFGRPMEATVVGVSRALRYNGLTSATVPELYVDYRVRPFIMLLFVRTDLPAGEAVPMLRAAVRHADPSGRITIDQITSLDGEVDRHLARPRFFLALIGTFGLSALVLAAAGLYGVMAFAVEARKHDIGVRLALGASPSWIAGEILQTGGALTAAGLLGGVVAAYAATGAMQALLFGVAPRDPATFAATALVVAFIAFVACWLPARRARRTDPLAVMRAD
jgi:predicted permease